MISEPDPVVFLKHIVGPRLGRRITKQKMVPVTKRGGFGLEKYGGQSVLVIYNYMLGY